MLPALMPDTVKSLALFEQAQYCTKGRALLESAGRHRTAGGQPSLQCTGHALGSRAKCPRLPPRRTHPADDNIKKSKELVLRVMTIAVAAGGRRKGSSVSITYSRSTSSLAAAASSGVRVG